MHFPKVQTHYSFKRNNSSRMKGKGLSFLLNADGTMRMLLSLSLHGSVFVFLLSCILGNINTGSLRPSIYFLVHQSLDAIRLYGSVIYFPPK